MSEEAGQHFHLRMKSFCWRFDSHLHNIKVCRMTLTPRGQDCRWASALSCDNLRMKVWQGLQLLDRRCALVQWHIYRHITHSKCGSLIFDALSQVYFYILQIKTNGKINGILEIGIEQDKIEARMRNRSYKLQLYEIQGHQEILLNCRHLWEPLKPFLRTWSPLFSTVHFQQFDLKVSHLM